MLRILTIVAILLIPGSSAFMFWREGGVGLKGVTQTAMGVQQRPATLDIQQRPTTLDVQQRPITLAYPFLDSHRLRSISTHRANQERLSSAAASNPDVTSSNVFNYPDDRYTSPDSRSRYIQKDAAERDAIVRSLSRYQRTSTVSLGTVRDLMVGILEEGDRLRTVLNDEQRVEPALTIQLPSVSDDEENVLEPNVLPVLEDKYNVLARNILSDLESKENDLARNILPVSESKGIILARNPLTTSENENDILARNILHTLENGEKSQTRDVLSALKSKERFLTRNLLPALKAEEEILARRSLVESVLNSNMRSTDKNASPKVTSPFGQRLVKPKGKSSPSRGKTILRYGRSV